MYNKEASKLNIFRTLSAFEEELTKTDNLLIIFSGCSEFDEEQAEGYWIPVEGTRIRSQLISNSELTERILRMRAHHIYILTNSIFYSPIVHIWPTNKLGLGNKPSRRLFACSRRRFFLNLNLFPNRNTNYKFLKELNNFLSAQNSSFMSSQMEQYIIGIIGEGSSQSAWSGSLWDIGNSESIGEFVFRPINKDERDWKIALKNDTEEAYLSFLDEYPLSTFKDIAKQKLEFLIQSRAWARVKRVNMINRYREFIRNNPGSPFIVEAEEALLSLRMKSSSDNQRTKINEYPIRTSEKPPLSIIKYPVISSPKSVTLNEKFFLKISIKDHQREGSMGIIEIVPEEYHKSKFIIGFEIISEGFHFPNGRSGEVEIDVVKNTSSTYELALIPLEDESKNVKREIIVVFLFEGVRCGIGYKSIEIISQNYNEYTIKSSSSSIRFNPRRSPPDLEIEIYAENKEDLSRFTCLVRSVHLPELSREERRGKLILSKNAKDYAKNLISDAAKVGDTLERSLYIGSSGDKIYALTPECIKVIYWLLHEKLGRRFKTILIYSDEPWIPWEIMRPERNLSDGKVEQHDFLSLEKEVGRWINEGAGDPVQFLKVTNPTLVAPQYLSGALRFSSEEADWLENKLKTKRINPCTKESFVNSLVNGKTSLLHYCGHAKSYDDGNQSAIELEDGAISARMLSAREIKNGKFGLNNPLVFLNACETNQISETLDGIGGLASAFIILNAGAVIGTAWPVNDYEAKDFALLFYEELFKSKGSQRIGRLLKKVRRKLVASQKHSFLAYTLFGDPLAEIYVEK